MSHTDQPYLSAQSWQLPRRDYLLLPAIFVLTILLLLGGGEIAARIIYVQDDAAEPCEYLTPTGFRYHSLCVSRTKVWEGPWITQQFNDCGYRAAESCAIRPADSLRVAVVGSSTARGALVNYPDSFAARASAAMSGRCGGLVDFQNLGTEPSDVDRIDLRISEALALHPSAIVMMIGAYDLLHLKDAPPVVAGENRPPLRPNPKAVANMLRRSRLFVLMQYYLYLDPAFQVRAFLLNGEPADYLRPPLSPTWQRDVDNFGDLLGRITAQTGSVPVVLVFSPERAQAALAGQVPDPPGIDPFAIGAALQQVAAGHGVHFFDATRAFGSAADFRSLYYLTDGHPNAGGHAVLANVVEHALLSQPAFARCAER
jgi:GDSL-like Lipase/Acylhydrolase family